MANLNALIAQGAQFDLPNPVDQYSKVMQLQAAQQQMQMQRQQMQQIQEDRAGFAKLREKLADQNLTPEDYELALINSPSKDHQRMGLELRSRRNLLADYDKAQKESGLGAEPPMASAEVPAPMAAPAEVPMAAPVAPKREMFVTKDSSGRSRYLVDGAEVSPQEYQSAQSGVVVGAAPAARLNAFPLPAFEPTNALAAQVAPAAAAEPVANAMLAQPAVGNAMASKQAQIAEINKQLKIATSPRFAEVPNIDKEIARLERQLKQLTESPFAKPDTKDYTPASLAAFAVSGNYADLVPKAGKADKEASLFSTINPSDYTQDSVRAFALSKNYGDLVPKAGKTDSPISNVNPNDFTPASVQKFALSRNYGDLVLKPVVAAPRAEQPPVAVVDPVTGKQIYVSREEALRGRMAPASAMEGLAPKEIQAREAKYPVAKRATTTVSATMTEIENTIDRLLANEKGLSGITGFVGGRTYAVTNEARKAEADLKQLKNLAFVQGLTELRNASSTGAGVGNVSNKEGDRFENLKASLEQTQSTDDLIASLKRLKSQSTATRDTVNQAFEDTYAYRTNTAAPQGTGGFKYLGKE